MKAIQMSAFLLILFNLRAASAEVPVFQFRPFPLPGGDAGVGFDDLLYSSNLQRVLVPAGRTGDLDLIDPKSTAITSISGFSSEPKFSGGHDFGVTSADEGGGYVFAVERTTQELVVVDPGKRRIIGRTKLAHSPDYVRYVQPTNEVWVTEPDGDQIEVFSLAPGVDGPVTHPSRVIPVPGGPESLVIDPARMQAYTHLWKAETMVISLKDHRVVGKWPNGCVGSRGIALDEGRGFLFTSCAEGKAVVMDLNGNGAILSSLESGSGVDIISYNEKLGHLYFPGGKSQTMAVLGVSDKGGLSVIGMGATAPGAHCVAADGQNGVWICDPSRGRLLYYRDALPSSRSR